MKIVNSSCGKNGFSVIMPTYNQASFIRRAILSLFKQTFSGWELIIVNDGCTDETELFIADYLKEPKITYIKNGCNKGIGHAINQGIEIAKYKYIAYLPSDDFMMKIISNLLKKRWINRKILFLRLVEYAMMSPKVRVFLSTGKLLV